MIALQRLDHLVLTVSDVEATCQLDDVVKHFHGLEVPIMDGPVERTGTLGPILSVYIRDPDGNLIEVSNVLSILS